MRFSGFFSGKAAPTPTLPPDPPPNEPVLPLHAGATGAIYGEPTLLATWTHALTAVLQLPGDQVLVGTEQGQLLLWQLVPGRGCVLLARGAASRASAVEQLVMGTATAPRAFVLCDGTLAGVTRSDLRPCPPLPVSRVLCVAARPPDPGACEAAIACVCVATCRAVLLFTYCCESEGVGGDEPEVLRPTDRWQLDAQLALPASLPPTRSLCWSGQYALMLGTAASLHLLRLDLYAHNAHAGMGGACAAGEAKELPEAVLVLMLQPHSDAADNGPPTRFSGGGRASGGGGGSAPAVALAMGPEEMLLVGGGGGGASAVAVGVDATLGWRTRQPFALEGGSPSAAALGWPLLLSCPPTTSTTTTASTAFTTTSVAAAVHVHVHDVLSGAKLQSIRLPSAKIVDTAARVRGSGGGAADGPGATAGAGAGPGGARVGAGGGGKARREGDGAVRVCLCARGRWSVLIARGAALFWLPALSEEGVRLEQRWLQQVAQRPWDAVLVENYIARVLAQSHHPLPQALAQLSGAFDRAFKAEAGAAADEADALCSAACFAARRHAQRIVGEALALFPPLQLSCVPDASGALDGALGAAGAAGTGAAGAELLSAVETAAFGAIRRTLSSLFAERVAPQQPRYEQQLHLLSHLVMPSHLLLPAALCETKSHAAKPDATATPEGTAAAAAAAAAVLRAPLPYARAISRLRQLPLETGPRQMLQCLVETCRLIDSDATAMGGTPISADELMPLATYVMLRSQVASLPAELAMLAELASESERLGEGGYCLATFQVAGVWLMNLKWDEMQHPPPPAAAVPPAAVHASRRRKDGAAGGDGSGGVGSATSAPTDAAAATAERPGSCGVPTPARRKSSSGLRDARELREARGERRGSREVRPDGRTRSAAREGTALPQLNPSIASSMELLRKLEAEMQQLQPPSQGAAPAAPPREASDGPGGGGAGNEGGLPATSSAQDLNALSVAGLLGLARQHGIDCSCCVEKQDLVELLCRRAVPSPLPSQPAARPGAAVPPPAYTPASSSAGLDAGTPPRGGRSGAAAGAAGASGCAARASAQRTGSNSGGNLPRLGSNRTGRERQRDGATLRVSGERPTSGPVSKDARP